MQLDKRYSVRYNAAMKVLYLYLAVINLIAFGFMAADKRRAKNIVGGYRNIHCLSLHCWAGALARCWACIFAIIKPNTGILSWECL